MRVFSFSTNSRNKVVEKSSVSFPKELIDLLKGPGQLLIFPSLLV